MNKGLIERLQLAFEHYDKESEKPRASIHATINYMGFAFLMMYFTCDRETFELKIAKAAFNALERCNF